MKLLLAEDERDLSKAIVKILEKNNYSVDAVYDGNDALDYLRSDAYDGAVVDLMMPGLDGISVIKKLRAENIGTPVLILTAKSEISDKVEGLDCGANDYMTKPFDSAELLARIRAMTRSRSSQDNKLRMGNVSLDRASFELSSPSGSLRLANKEFQMMEFFMSNPHVIISAERFLEKIWDFDSDAEVNVVWVYIAYLRKKLASLDADIVIKAVRNAGYSLENKDDR